MCLQTQDTLRIDPWKLLQVHAMKHQYGETEAFHSAQIDQLQHEIDAQRAEGKHKEAEAKLAYLAYHQDQVKRIRSVIDLAGEKGSIMEEVINALKVCYIKPSDCFSKII